MALRVWLPLTGTLENKGISNITISKDAEVTLNTNGKIGTCASCETSGKIITATIPGLGAMLGRGKSYTMCAWIKWLNHGTSGWVAQLATTNPTGFWWTNTSSNPRIVWNENDGGKRCGDNSLATDYTNWHHYAFVITKNADGTSIITQHYTDGVRSTSYPGTTWNGSSQSLASGDTLKLYPYTASINDFRIYDHALSAAEVHEISQGLVLHYKLDDLPYNFSTNTVTSFTNFTIGQYYYTIFSINMTDFLSSTGAVNGDKFTFSVDINATSNTKRLCARVQHYNSSSDRNSVMGNYIAPGQSGRSSVIFTVNTAYTRLDFLINNGDNGSVTANSTEQYKCTRIEKGEVHSGYLPTGITPYIQDSSGYNHNGTINGTLTLSIDTARYLSATTSSVESNILNTDSTIPTALTTNNKYTMCLWLKTSATTNRWIYAIGDGSGTRRGLWITTSGSKPQFAYSGSGAFTGTATINDNKWHHITFTIDGATSQCFVDGVQCGSSTSTKTDVVGSNKIDIVFNGSDIISDFRLYATALDADAIRQLYEVGAKVDNLGSIHTFEFQEKSNPKIYKAGITEHKLLTESRLLNDVTSISYQPEANANNSCSSFITLDLEEYAEQNVPLIIHVSYLASWTNFTAGTGGTFNIRMQAQNRKKENNSWAWEGSTFISGNFTSAINANATGSQQYDFDTIIPTSYFSTYNGCKCRIRCDYSSGSGTITISNVKVTIQPNKFKIKNNYLQTNQLIEK